MVSAEQQVLAATPDEIVVRSQDTLPNQEQKRTFDNYRTDRTNEMSKL